MIMQRLRHVGLLRDILEGEVGKTKGRNDYDDDNL